MRFNDDVSAAIIAVDPSQWVNWLYFVNESMTNDQFMSPPTTRTEMSWDEALGDQWRDWYQRLGRQLMTHNHQDGPPVGCDAPTFESLHDLPELRARAEQRWPQFLEWWRGAQPQLVDHVMDRAVHDRIRQARAQLPPNTTAIFHVIGLVGADSLRSDQRHDDGHTVFSTFVTAGLLADDAKFRHQMRDYG